MSRKVHKTCSNLLGFWNFQTIFTRKIIEMQYFPSGHIRWDAFRSKKENRVTMSIDLIDLVIYIVLSSTMYI